MLEKKKKRKKKNDFYFIHRFGEILHSANNKCPQYWLQLKRNVFFFMVWLVRQYHASDHLTWDNTGRQRGLYLDSTLGPRICILSKWFLKKSVKHLGLLCGSFFFLQHLFNIEHFTLRSRGSQNIQWLKGKGLVSGGQRSCFQLNGVPGYNAV